VEQLNPGETITARMWDGTVMATVETVARREPQQSETA
jgi:hypothetical protein